MTPEEEAQEYLSSMPVKFMKIAAEASSEIQETILQLAKDLEAAGCDERMGRDLMMSSMCSRLCQLALDFNLDAESFIEAVWSTLMGAHYAKEVGHENITDIENMPDELTAADIPNSQVVNGVLRKRIVQ
jgi:hypothetical protein